MLLLTRQLNTMAARVTRLQEITESKWMDLVGVAIVLGVSFASGFHKTVVSGLPIGIFSTLGAGASMMVTRWVTKRNNIGNAVGLLTAINSGVVDYYLGNEAAFLTYPVSFIGAGVSYLYWKRRKNRVPRKIDPLYFAMSGIAFLLAFSLNYIGFTDFLSKPLDGNWSKFLVTGVITGITYSGILNTPRMYADTWAFWQVYNVLKIYQNILFVNIAFIAKYCFYLVNATMAWVVWHRVRKSVGDNTTIPEVV